MSIANSVMIVENDFQSKALNILEKIEIRALPNATALDKLNHIYNYYKSAQDANKKVFNEHTSWKAKTTQNDNNSNNNTVLPFSLNSNLESLYAIRLQEVKMSKMLDLTLKLIDSDDCGYNYLISVESPVIGYQPGYYIKNSMPTQYQLTMYQNLKHFKEFKHISIPEVILMKVLKYMHCDAYNKLKDLQNKYCEPRPITTATPINQVTPVKETAGSNHFTTPCDGGCSPCAGTNDFPECKRIMIASVDSLNNLQYQYDDNLNYNNVLVGLHISHKKTTIDDLSVCNISSIMNMIAKYTENNYKSYFDEYLFLN